MKSSNNELQKRGYISDSNLSQYSEISNKQLVYMLSSTVASERTSAIILLRDKYNVNDEMYITLLLNRLCKEKALYTKLEICKTLESGNTSTASIMCDYIGRIGNNQHTEVPNNVSKKRSFPLPRDIVARTLGRMDSSVYPIIMEKLDSENEKIVSELLDATGYLVFNNTQLGNTEIFNHIQKTYNRFSNKELIVWKIAECCSVFPLNESISLLNKIKSSTTNQIITAEANKSLSLIKK